MQKFYLTLFIFASLLMETNASAFVSAADLSKKSLFLSDDISLTDKVVDSTLSKKSALSAGVQNSPFYSISLVEEELNASAPTYNNTGILTTQDGYDVWINEISSFDAMVANTGELNVTGTGWGIYGTPFPTRGGIVNIDNAGIIQRIQLEEMDQTTIFNRPTSTSSGTPNIQGAVLLGTNSTIANYGGKFSNLDIDSSMTKGNMISFGYGGFLNNGVQTFYTVDEEGNIALSRVEFYRDSEITTDKIQFGEKGYFANGAVVDVEHVKMGVGGSILNIGNPYVWQEDIDNDGDVEIVAGELLQNASTFSADLVELSDNSVVTNEMGTTMKIGTLNGEDNVSIVNGAEYSLDYNKFLTLNSTKTVTTVVTDDSGAEVSRNVQTEIIQEVAQFPKVPHASKLELDRLSLGSNSTVTNQSNSIYEGKSVSFGDSGVFDIKSGTVTLSDIKDDSKLSFAEKGTLNVGVEYQEPIYVPKIEAVDDVVTTTDAGTGQTTSITTTGEKIGYDLVLQEGYNVGQLNVDTIQMGKESVMNVSGGIIQSNKVLMDESSTINISSERIPLQGSEVSEESSTSQEVIVAPTFTATEGIYFKDFGTLDISGGVINSPLINFEDDGRFLIGSTFSVDKVNMGERSYVEATGVLTSDVTLGSDSFVQLNVQMEEEEDAVIMPYSRVAGGFVGSLKKADGARNVNVQVDTSGSYYALLKGEVDVDSILINTGLLEVSGSIKGDINLNTDTTLRITGTDVNIHDPIDRLEDTTNTTVEIKLEDEVFYETSNTINVETLLLTNGGISINKPVDIDTILMNSDTTVRLRGNFDVGGIKEVNGDAVNTTLEIDAGKGKSINSSGDVQVDRLLISSGNYNAFHEINTLSQSGLVTVPPAFEEGIELSTDTSLTTFANVTVNRVVRNQEKMANNEEVKNTTLSVNSDHFQVRSNVDIDNLIMNGGVFEFLNYDGTNAVNITNDLQLKPYSSLAGSGVLNIKSGHLELKENARLAVSMKSLDEKPISELKVVSTDTTIENSARGYQTKDLLVETDESGYIDVRAKGNENDKIHVEGTVNLADGTRIIIRNIKENQEYEILTANQLNGNADKLRTSFLWIGANANITNNALSLKIEGLQTLKEGLSTAEHSKNVDALADMLISVRESEGAYSIDPFLDNVFFAESAETAVQVLDDYSPEGYLNTQQAHLRLQRVFKDSVMSEMNAMRNYRIKGNGQRYYSKNPYYYGRPGRENYYYGFKHNRRNPYQERHSDKGGIWAKPFMITHSQDDKDNQSGYDFDFQGLTAGIDRKVGVFSFGLAAMYATGDMEQKNDKLSSDMTTYGMGVYASVMPHYSRMFMDFYALWSETSTSSTRKIASLSETAKADFDMTAYTAGFDVGYEILVAPNFILTPKIGLDYTSIEMDDIKEKGTGRALVALKGTDLTSIQMPVELKASLDFGSHAYRFRPEAHVRWTHEFGDTASKTTANFVRYSAPVNVEGVNVDKDVFTVGGSLLWLYGLSEFELKYDYDFSSTSTGHSINMGYKYLF